MQSSTLEEDSMKKIKTVLVALFFAYAFYAVAAKAYNVHFDDYTPLPAGGADVAP